MSEESTMKMAAEIVDKWSGPLKAMNKAMRETGGIARGVHGAGEKSVSAHDKAYRELHNTINKVRGTISSAFTPTMATLGITTLSVGGAIASVVASVKKLGDSYYQIQDASKRAGLSPQKIDALSVAFENLGIAPEAARAGLSGLGEQLDRTNRRVPDAIKRWNSLGGAYEIVGKHLQGLSNSQAVDKILDYMDKIHATVDQKRKLFADVLNSPQLVPLATKTTEQIRAALAAGLKFEKEHPYNPALAGQLNDTFNKLRVTLQGVERDFANAFGDNTISAIRAVTSEVQESVKTFIEIKRDIDDLVGGKKKIELHGPSVEPGGWIYNTQKWLKEPFDPFAFLKTKAGTGADESTLPPGARPRMYTPTDDEKTIKKGTLDALREWYGGLQTAGNAAPWNGSGGMPFRRGIRQGGGGAGEMPNLEGLTGNEYLKAQRARFAEEFKNNPALALRADAITSLENEGAKTGVLESLFNRMSMAHKTAEFGMRGGPNSFYGPGRHPGMIEARMRAIVNNPKWKARLDAYTNAALVGSNLIRGYTDQGSAGDPNYSAGGVGVNINRERFNNWNYPGAAAWRENQQRHVNESSAVGSIWDKGTKPLDLLRLGKQSGLMGGPQGFKSDASLRIDVNAPPGSVKTRLAHSGFEDVQFNRGLQMANASQAG